jgi:hypothetical protein
MRNKFLFPVVAEILICAEAAESAEPAIQSRPTIAPFQSANLVTTTVPALRTAQVKNPEQGKMLILTTRIYDKPPNGDRPGKGSKLFFRPRVAALENVQFSLRVGAPAIPSRSNDLDNCGPGIDGRMGPVRDGRVRVDLTFSNTTAEDASEDHLQLHTDSHRIVTTLNLGEKSKMRWANFNGSESAWVEFQVDEAP